jgi:DNA-binding beta-propeller fold protein YncE
MKRIKKIVVMMVLSLGAGVGSVQADLVYAVKLYPAQTEFLSFDTSAPGTQTVINGSFPASLYGYGLDFNPAGTVLYALQSPSLGSAALGTINTATGSFTPTATVTGLLSGESASGIKIDPTTGTFYVVSTDLTRSTLYTLNPGTGVATPVGFQTTAPAIIELAISASGQMYATDIVNDALYSIDKTNGAATLIGPVGLDLNFAQGMDFDYGNGLLYAAFAQSSAICSFGTLNLGTGAATVFANLGNEEMDIAIGNPVPVPGAVLLGAIGLSCAGWRLRRATT